MLQGILDRLDHAWTGPLPAGVGTKGVGPGVASKDVQREQRCSREMGKRLLRARRSRVRDFTS